MPARGRALGGQTEALKGRRLLPVARTTRRCYKRLRDNPTEQAMVSVLPTSGTRGSFLAWALIPLALALAGCMPANAGPGQGHARARELRSSAPGSGQFVRPGAPAPFACSVDADCAPGPVVNPANGCCDTGVHRGVFSRAYLEWRAGWMREHCGKVQCPVLPPPAPPLPCALQGRCVAGQCRNRCEQAAHADKAPATDARKPGSGPRCRAVPGATVQDRLEDIAGCFHAAVVALSREPAAAESLAAFLGATGLAGPADVTLGDGALVSWEVVGREHDSYEGGGMGLATTYRFSAPGHPESARITVVLSVGGEVK